MVTDILCLVVAVCALLRFFRGKGKRLKQENIAMLVLCGIIVAYCIPYPSLSMPAIEKIYTFLYQPISRYFLHNVAS